MTSLKPNPVARFLPSLTDVAFLLPLAFLFLRLTGGRYLLGDGDTGWHVRTGEWILQNGRVPDKDLFSYTKAEQPWYAWEWLWDVLFAWLHRHGGMAAVLVASMLVICFTSALLFRLVRRNCPNVLLAFAVTLAATAGSAMHWLARPHLFTLLFVVVFLSLLERVREGRTRLLCFLPMLTVLWTNLHGGFFVGIILIGCYAAGEVALGVVERDRDAARAALARSKPYFVTAFACACATLLNPYFYRLHGHLYHYLFNSRHLKYINEFQPTSFRSQLTLWHEPMALLGAVAVVWCLYHKRFAQAFIIAGWLHLALFAVRNLPIYLIVAAPAVAAVSYELLGRVRDARLAPWVRQAVHAFENLAAEFGVLDTGRRVYLTSALSFLAVATLFYLPAPTQKFRAEYDPARYPAKALSAIRGTNHSRSTFTHDEWGDYLIYRLYPDTKVFVDGRSDFYGDEFCDKYQDVLNSRYQWEETLGRYGVDTVLLPVDAPLTGALKESRRWRPVYDDGMAIVFRSEAAQAPAGRPRGDQASAAQPGGSEPGDRKVTNLNHRDPRITKPNKRSESL